MACTKPSTARPRPSSRAVSSRRFFLAAATFNFAIRASIRAVCETRRFCSSVMRALRKGQAGIFNFQGGIVGEARIVERAFGLGPCALTEAMALLQDRLANAES